MKFLPRVYFVSDKSFRLCRKNRTINTRKYIIMNKEIDKKIIDSLKTTSKDVGSSEVQIGLIK